ncbi:MAG: hypothetical protein ACRCX2_24075, partial [Paraclostridium sp.]
GLILSIIDEKRWITVSFFILGIFTCMLMLDVKISSSSYINKIHVDDISNIMMSKTDIFNSHFILDDDTITSVEEYVHAMTGYNLGDVIFTDNPNSKIELWVKKIEYNNQYINPEYTVDLIINTNTGGN